MDDLERLLLDDDKLVEAEDAATDRIYGGLQRWGRALFTGVVAANLYDAMTRLNNPALRVPLIDATLDVLREAGYMGAAVGRQQLSLSTLGAGVDWEGVNTSVLRWAMNYSYELVGGLTETTKQRLALEIARFAESGESLPKLVARLTDSDGGMFSKARARRIAVTEVTRAYAEGNLAAWRAGGTERIQWQTAMDERVCPICWPMQGKVTDIDKPFEHPTLGSIRIPAHVNCRCRIAPYIEVTVPDGWKPRFTSVEVY